MNKFLIIVLAFLTSSLNAEENAAKKELDPNFVKAVEALKKSSQEFEQNKDKSKDLEIGMRVFSDTLCLQSFNKEADNDYLRKNFDKKNDSKEDQEKLKELFQSEEFLKKILETQAQYVKNPKSMCSFKLDENTPSQIAKRKKEEEGRKGFSEIMALKKTIHPVLVKVISDMEKEKSIIASPRYRPIQLDDPDYEKNFVKVYEFETKFIESKTIAKMAMFPSECLESISRLYASTCKSKVKYSLVKGMATRSLLCADDNQPKLSKSCNYKQTFSDNNPRFEK